MTRDEIMEVISQPFASKEQAAQLAALSTYPLFGASLRDRPWKIRVVEFDPNSLNWSASKKARLARRAKQAAYRSTRKAVTDRAPKDG